MIFLARWLGSYNFGIYAYVFVIVTLLGLALSFGFNSSALRFISSYLAQRKLRRLSGFLKQSHSLALRLSILGALLGSGLVFAFRSIIEPHYFMPLLVGLLGVPIWTLLNQFEATARAFGWVHIAYVPGYILRPLLLIRLVGGLVLFGGTADAVGALWAMVGACAIAALAQGLLVYSENPPAFAQRKTCFPYAALVHDIVEFPDDRWLSYVTGQYGCSDDWQAARSP